jgi:hypothetical protein
MHPTPECCTLLCSLGLQLCEGNGPMIAFPLARGVGIGSVR